MANLILKLLKTSKTWIVNHKRTALEAIMAVLIALSTAFGTVVYKHNQSLSEQLELAQNNIEAYQEIANDSQQACGVLKVDITKLKESNDKLLQEIDSVRDANKIKASGITTAATQTQSIVVNKQKGVQGDLVEILKDTVYTDTINYNSLTKVSYTIGRDTVNIGLDIKNTQYLFTYKTREYKNKKNFLKRLFTWDFKKVDKYNYKIINTNDLLKESDLRVIEQE